jgi:hypothetical protein
MVYKHVRESMQFWVSFSKNIFNVFAFIALWHYKEMFCAVPFYAKFFNAKNVQLRCMLHWSNRTGEVGAFEV